MDQFSAHLDRGWDLVSRGDYAGAMLSARKSLELDADSPEAHNLMGFIYAAEGHAEDALEHYRHAIEIDESFVEAMLNAAEVLIHPLQDYSAAIEMIEDALDFTDIEDEIADAILLKVDALLSMGDREAAAQAIAQLPDVEFENPHLEFLIGRAKFEVGDIDGAEPRIQRALVADPQHGEARYYLGLILEARGDLRGMAMAFLQARDLDLAAPDPPWTLPNDQFEGLVQAAIRRLPKAIADRLEGALFIVSDVPGAEVVADGLDPRLFVLFQPPTEEVPGAGRLFVYKRNIERSATTAEEIENEALRSIERELVAVYKELAEHASTDDEQDSISAGRTSRRPTEHADAQALPHKDGNGTNKGGNGAS